MEYGLPRATPAYSRRETNIPVEDVHTSDIDIPKSNLASRSVDSRNTLEDPTKRPFYLPADVQRTVLEPDRYVSREPTAVTRSDRQEPERYQSLPSREPTAVSRSDLQEPERYQSLPEPLNKMERNTRENRFDPNPTLSRRYEQMGREPVPGSTASYLSRRQEPDPRSFDMEYRLGMQHGTVRPTGDRDIYDAEPRRGNSGSDIRDDQMSATTRSDPGELVMSPAFPRESDTSDRDSGKLVRKGDYSNDYINQMRLRSKSETDLNDISHETHRNSSPIHGSRLMELSKLSYQPSPILSHPVMQDTAGATDSRHANLDKLLAERILQRPLEPGMNYTETEHGRDYRETGRHYAETEPGRDYRETGRHYTETEPGRDYRETGRDYSSAARQEGGGLYTYNMRSEATEDNDFCRQR